MRGPTKRGLLDKLPGDRSPLAKARLAAHAAYAKTHPLTPFEERAWLFSLGTTDEERREVLRDLVRHVTTDDTLPVDAHLLRRTFYALDTRLGPIPRERRRRLTLLYVSRQLDRKVVLPADEDDDE